MNDPFAEMQKYLRVLIDHVLFKNKTVHNIAELSLSIDNDDTLYEITLFNDAGEEEIWSLKKIKKST